MSKFIDATIHTKEVYLNIEHSNGEVDTEREITLAAMAEHGDLEVKSIGEPRYDERHAAARPSRSDKDNDPDPTRQAGCTDVVLVAND